MLNILLIAELFEFYPLRPEAWLLTMAENHDSHFPERVTEEYRGVAKGSPCLSAVFRASESEKVEDGEALGDPIGEASLSPLPYLVRKFSNRALFLASTSCAIHCRFCFRRNSGLFASPNPSTFDINAACEWIAEREEIEEVILSGGDPLTLDAGIIGNTVAAFSGIASVKRVRIHTRRPIVEPGEVLPALEAAEKASFKPLSVVLHVAHPSEYTKGVISIINRMRDIGITISSQTVLLNGINADSGILCDLFAAADRFGAPPRYLHHPDRVAGGKSFRVSLARGLELYRANGGNQFRPPYVIDLPNGAGKAKVSDLEVVGEEMVAGGRRLRYRWNRPEGWDSISAAQTCEWWDIVES